MRELGARTFVVDCSSRTNDGRRTGERSRLVAGTVPLDRSARGAIPARARPRRRAGRGGLSTERSERGPLRRRRRRRRATRPSARRDGRGEPTGRPAGRSVPVCRARGRLPSVAVGVRLLPSSTPRTGHTSIHTRGHVRPHPSRPQPFFNNNMVYYYYFLSYFRPSAESPPRGDSNKRVSTYTQVYCNVPRYIKLFIIKIDEYCY